MAKSCTSCEAAGFDPPRSDFMVRQLNFWVLRSDFWGVIVGFTLTEKNGLLQALLQACRKLYCRLAASFTANLRQKGATLRQVFAVSLQQTVLRTAIWEPLLQACRNCGRPAAGLPLVCSKHFTMQIRFAASLPQPSSWPYKEYLLQACGKQSKDHR